MKMNWKSFGIGVVFTLAVIAVIAYPYKDEIVWAYKNRDTIDKVGGVASTLKGLLK